MKKGILPNKIFSALKWILATAIAPIILFINEIGSIYGFDTTVIVRTIAAIATLLAALLGLSNYNYNKTK